MSGTIKDAKEQMMRAKAKNLRYKKAVLERLNLYDIREELYDIACACDEVRYYFDDDSTLLDALDGDEDEEYEFRMMFGDLSGNCEKLSQLLNDEYITEYFDDYLVGILGNKYNALGYDGYEEDYYHLCSYESGLAKNESGKRLMRLTKEQMISVAGQVFGVCIAYLDLTQKYDYLKATMDILRQENTSYLQMVRQIEDAYNAAAEEGFFYSDEKAKNFDKLLEQLPDRAWIE